MADLARHIDEHRAARLTDKPMLPAAQLGHQSQLQGRKQWASVCKPPASAPGDMFNP